MWIDTGMSYMNITDTIKEMTEIIESESEDIEKLEAIIESKRQHIADAMKVLSALEGVKKL